MELFENNKSKGKKSHFRSLVGLAIVDGHLNESEKKMLSLVADRIGLSRKEFDEVINSENLEFVIPEDEGKRIEQILDLVYLMLVDGKIYEDEFDYCVEMAVRLGFRPKIVDSIINFIIEKMKKGAPKEKVKSETEDFLSNK